MVSGLIADLTKQFVIQNAIDAISLGSLFALFALGIAIIFGIMQLINFAHGELIIIGGYTLVLLSGIPLAALAFVIVVVVAAFALALDRIAFRPVRGSPPSTLLVTSFAVSFLLQSLAILILGATPKTTNVSTTFTEFFTIGDVFVSKLNVITVSVTIILLIGLGLLFSKTRTGIEMRAAAENFRMAQLVGINADRVIAVAFMLSGVLAATAAMLLVAQTGTVTPQMGVTPVLFAFMATILGGMGSLAGAVLGGFLVGALTVALQAGLPLGVRPLRDAFVFAIVFGILVIRPQGLIVTRAARTRV
jgi:branched-chain amino acid transport system permease protein